MFVSLRNMRAAGVFKHMMLELQRRTTRHYTLTVLFIFNSISIILS